MKPLRLHRRTVLRSAGVSLALPLLEAMRPRRAAAQSSEAPPRVLFVYFPSGYRKGQWLAPAATGTFTRFTLPTIARALEPWRERGKLTLVTGLANQPASVAEGGAGIHSRGTGCSLTCTELRPDGFVGEGISADQVIVKEAGPQAGCLSSLVLGLPHERVPTFSEEGFGALYYNNVSFTGPRSNVQKVSDPADLFLRLTTCPGWRDAPATRRALFHQNVMGSVKEKAARLLKCAGQGDRLRLEEYFTSISELERRFLPPSALTATCPRPSAPLAVGNTLAESAEAMFELTTLALRCDLARVGTLMMDGALSRRRYGLPELGAANYIHGLSHGEIGGEEADGPRWVRLTTHYFELFHRLLSRLDAVSEGQRTLLDNTIVYIHSEFGDGDVHQFGEQPLVVAGGGGGRLQMGRHLALPAGTPQANALLTVMQAMGVRRQRFGDSTGPLSGLATPSG